MILFGSVRQPLAACDRQTVVQQSLSDSTDQTTRGLKYNSHTCVKHYITLHHDNYAHRLFMAYRRAKPEWSNPKSSTTKSTKIKVNMHMEKIRNSSIPKIHCMHPASPLPCNLGRGQYMRRRWRKRVYFGSCNKWIFHVCAENQLTAIQNSCQIRCISDWHWWHERWSERFQSLHLPPGQLCQKVPSMAGIHASGGPAQIPWSPLAQLPLDVCGITYMCVCTHWGELYVQAGGCNSSPLKYPQGERKTRHDAMFWKVSWPTRYHTVCIIHTTWEKKSNIHTRRKFTNVTFLQWFAKVLCEVDPEWVSVIGTYPWPCLLTSSALILHWPFNGHEA